MKLLYPRIRLAHLRDIFLWGLAGALIAGAFGILHDQITYTISPEYFTRLKFRQFAYANFGWPARVFVAEIGFLASWWVGFIAAWFQARVAVPAWGSAGAARHLRLSIAIVFAAATLGAFAGYLMGVSLSPGAALPGWQFYARSLGVHDLPAFVRVAYIHNGSYIGGGAGLIISLLYLVVAKRRGALPRP